MQCPLYWTWDQLPTFFPGITQSEHMRISALPDQIGQQPEVGSFCAGAESWKGKKSCF